MSQNPICVCGSEMIFDYSFTDKQFTEENYPNKKELEDFKKRIKRMGLKSPRMSGEFYKCTNSQCGKVCLSNTKIILDR